MIRSKPQLLEQWHRLVNMTAEELEEYLHRPEARAGLTRLDAQRQGLHSGQETGRAVLRLLRTPPEDWSWQQWDQAQRQVLHIQRLNSMLTPLYDARGRPTSKLLGLMRWGHLPAEALEFHEVPVTIRPGHHLQPNRAAHPFRSVEVERQLRDRASSDAERARYRQQRYVVAGIDQRGRDWSLGSTGDLVQALSRAERQRTYPRAVVLDVETGEVIEP